MASDEKVIYDIGANNGDDIPYYLLKGDKIVAIEANPSLCEEIRCRFSTDINNGRLIVENCVATVHNQDSEVDFFIHRSDHLLSQFPIPPAHEYNSFQKVKLPAKDVCSLLSKHGTPYYVKIDIEGYDAELLAAMFAHNVFPEYISAESHSSRVFAELVASQRYNAFKIIEGESVASKYKNRVIFDERGRNTTKYSFPNHSSGPFGKDVDGRWLNADGLFRLLGAIGLGWRDIHASRSDVGGDLTNSELIEALFNRLYRAFARRAQLARWINTQ